MYWNIFSSGESSNLAPNLQFSGRIYNRVGRTFSLFLFVHSLISKTPASFKFGHIPTCLICIANVTLIWYSFFLIAFARGVRKLGFVVINSPNIVLETTKIVAKHSQDYKLCQWSLILASEAIPSRIWSQNDNASEWKIPSDTSSFSVLARGMYQMVMKFMSHQ